MTKAFVICGSPAVGKTTYGAKLAEEKRAALIDIDTCTEQLVQAALRSAGHDPDDRDSSYFKQTYREPIYQTLFAIARANLTWIDVVIVGPFTKEIRDKEWPEKLKQTLGADVEIHYLTCDVQERRERIRERSNPRDASKLLDWENHIKYFADERAPEFEHLLVNTTARGK